MPRKQRLTSADFRRLRPTKRLHGAIFSLSVAALSGGPSRFACVVSKKVAMRANVRNLIQRRARAAIRAHCAGLPPGGAYVLTAKREAVGASYAEIEADVAALVRKIARSR